MLFSQATLPLLLAALDKKTVQHPPTLIFTGATASVKANALVSAFNTGKFALRALSSSLAKEFGPKGVHVGHAIIDGPIDTPRAKEWFKDAAPDSLISPEGVRLSVLLLVGVADEIDCGCVLAFAHAAKIGVYVGGGYQAVRGEVVITGHLNMNGWRDFQYDRT